MFSLTISVNDVPKVVNIPECYEELNWKTYVTAVSVDVESDPSHALSVLIDVPVDVINNMLIEHQRLLFNKASFFWNDEPMATPIPDEVLEYQITTGTWQNIIDCEQEFKRVGALDLPQIAASQMIVKTYANVDLSTMNVPEALGYWDFFLPNSVTGTRGGRTCTTTRQMRMRYQQELKKYRSLDGLRPYTLLRKVTHSDMMRSYPRRRLLSIQRCYSKKLNAITQKSIEGTRTPYDPNKN